VVVYGTVTLVAVLVDHGNYWSFGDSSEVLYEHGV
jgi:hypothetical protein